MPLELYININYLTLLVIILLAAFAGFMLRSAKFRQKITRINRLEKELLQAHAETLASQKEYCDLESRLKDLHIPVIPMIQATQEEEQEKQEGNDAAGLRKKRPTRTA
jgi:hypothetical protein